MKFGASEAARLWKTESPGDFLLDGVSVDSRRIRPGSLFVALPGQRVDGHEFVADALARGAAVRGLRLQGLRMKTCSHAT